MSDDSDLLIAAAATAAVVTWMGTRRPRRGAAGRLRRAKRALLAGLARSWRETPLYGLVAAIRDAFFRRR